jgi:hypothetical protein
MRLVEMKLEDLIRPDQFELTSQDDLFDRLVQAVNNALEDELNNGDELFETSDAHVEIVLDANDDYDGDVTPDMVEALETLYKEIGWQKVTYAHQEETENEYESHNFNFYFKTIPGVSL